jgi:hypothetical protein
MHTVKAMAAFCLGCLVAGSALAATSAKEAARLGQDLTPMGAERAGNADGSIPAWDPASTPVPANFVAGSDNYVNPFPDEKPLYTIDNSNWKDYAENLTEGTKSVFERLGPKGFTMNVYPTKRSHSAPDWLYANNVRNATGATLVEDGQKIEGNYPGVPFPIPQSALEVLWNHLIRFQTDYSLDYDVYYVGADGRAILSTTAATSTVYPMYREPDQLVGETPWLLLRINYRAPARRAGEILLVHEPGADYTQGKGRKAWQYLTGQRRVRMAPAVSFDTPNPAVAGTSTYDDFSVFNGSPERYDWTLLGKKEIIVPYNNYDFLFQQKIEDMLGDHFLKPEYIRWEKHRVWVIEANLKEGQRHLYAKRRYYLDEDSWAALTGEVYDGRDTLWRVQYAYPAKLYDRDSTYGACYGGYDLLQGIYNINTKPIPGKFKNGVTVDDKYFTPDGMARSGIR